MRKVRALDGTTRSMGDAVRPTVRLMAAPYGFTLSAGGVLATSVGQHGYPGFLPIWLFAVGGCVGFCLTALASKAAGDRPPAAHPASGGAVYNLVALAVLPIVYEVTRDIPTAALSFAVAGFLAVVLYVVGYSVLDVLASRRSRKGRSGPVEAGEPDTGTPDTRVPVASGVRNGGV